MAERRQGTHQPGLAILLAGGVYLILNAVRDEQDDVAGQRGEHGLLILLLLKQAERNAADVETLHFTGATDEGRDGAGVGHDHFARLAVPKRHQESDEVGVHLTFHEGFVDGAHQHGGAATTRRERAQQAGDHRSVECGGGSFTAGITEGKHAVVAGVIEEVIDVTRDLAGGASLERNFQVRNHWGFARLQHLLQTARGAQILLHALLTLGEFFIEARVEDGHGDLRGEQREEAGMLFGEEAEGFAFEVHDADEAILRDERHGEFRADVGVRGNIARIAAGVGDAHGGAFKRGGAGDAFAERDVAELQTFVVALAEVVAQGGLLVIDEHDAEGIKVDEHFDAGGEALQQLVKVEDGRQFAGEVSEGAQGLVVALHAAMEPGIVDGEGDAGWR